MRHALISQAFLTFLKEIPVKKIKKWEVKYQMPEEPEPEPEPQPKDSRIVRISSSAIVWR